MDISIHNKDEFVLGDDTVRVIQKLFKSFYINKLLRDHSNTKL